MAHFVLYEWDSIVTSFLSDCLDAALKKEVMKHIFILKEQGHRARFPTSRNFKNCSGLFELRADRNKVRIRILYCFLPGRNIVFLALAQKKEALKESVVETAKQRMKLIDGNFSNVTPI